MTVGISAKEVDKVINALKEKIKGVQTEEGKAVAKACLVVQREIQTSMTNTPTNGSVSYYTHNKKIPHHPSLPYNPPAVDTGTLRRSISIEVDEENLKGKVGSVLANPPYGAYLELAEYGSSKMLPRPWLKPAMEKTKADVEEILKAAVKRGVK